MICPKFKIQIPEYAPVSRSTSCPKQCTGVTAVFYGPRRTIIPLWRPLKICSCSGEVIWQYIRIFMSGSSLHYIAKTVKRINCRKWGSFFFAMLMWSILFQNTRIMRFFCRVFFRTKWYIYSNEGRVLDYRVWNFNAFGVG